MDNPKAVPEAPVRQREDGRWVVVVCPLCGAESNHLHAAAEADALGSKVAHCLIRVAARSGRVRGEMMTPTERAAIAGRGVRVRRDAASPERIAEIEARVRQGESGYSIADALDMPRSTIARIVRVARADGRV